MAPSWKQSRESAISLGLPRIDERQPTSSREADTGGAIAEVSPQLDTTASSALLAPTAHDLSSALFAGVGHVVHLPTRKRMRNFIGARHRAH
jgi:hypothetical protein